MKSIGLKQFFFAIMVQATISIALLFFGVDRELVGAFGFTSYIGALGYHRLSTKLDALAKEEQK